MIFIESPTMRYRPCFFEDRGELTKLWQMVYNKTDAKSSKLDHEEPVLFRHIVPHFKVVLS